MQYSAPYLHQNQPFLWSFEICPIQNTRTVFFFFFFFFFFFWDGEHCTSSRLRYQKEIQKELVLWKWCYFIENLLIESTTLNKLFNLSVSDYQSFLLMFKTTHQCKPKFGFPCKLLGRVECCISWVLWN